MGEMKPEIGDGILQEYLTALNELKISCIRAVIFQRNGRTYTILSNPAVNDLRGTILMLEVAKRHLSFKK